MHANMYNLTCIDLAKLTKKINNLAYCLHSIKQSETINQQRNGFVNAVPNVDFNYKEFQEPLVGQYS